MEKMGRILTLFVVILALAASPVFSQSSDFSISDLTGAVDGFSDAIAKALPFNSTMGLNWSDAYIGQLIGVPPHFGFGLSFGSTSMNIGAVSGVANMLGFNIPSQFPIGFPLPGYTLEARIGGFIIPFDIGFKFGFLDMKTSSIPVVNGLGMNVGLNYQLLGADIRYAVIDSELIPVKLSVGAAFNRLTGGVSTKANGMGKSFDFKDSANSDHTLSFDDPNLDLSWETTSLELRAHVSFPVLLITPYAGVGAGWAWSKAGYQVKSEIKVDGDPIDEEFYDAIKGFGVSGIGPNGFESFREINNFHMRLYAGISFNLAVIKIDLTGMFNIMDPGFGFTMGLRFQL